jgi:hypothetical protein
MTKPSFEIEITEFMGTVISKFPNLSEDVVMLELTDLMSAAKMGALSLETIFPFIITSCALRVIPVVMNEIAIKYFKSIRDGLIVNLIIENHCLAFILEVS